MELQITNGGSLEVNEAIFAKDFNETLVHQAVVAYMAGGRSGTKAQKTRSEVSGGGAKPWRQKGTGRARAGTSRGPIWRKGGVTFAAKPRDYSKKLNKKMYRAAIRSIFSELVRQDRLVLVDDFSIEEPKTKLMVAKLAELACNDVLIITDADDMNVHLSTRNIPHCEALDVTSLNPVSLVGHEKVLMTTAALAKVQEWLA
ncbi:50S ribosomal protein L4 [Leucothrix pacifica]|uniref:Large ribosomal subunit protein uL4 n=1 Tax=Leucothrix pacifica TaxID=1247513 RepID=A0A317CNC6_9GAMM|nr:50S ribosomal protein L4 [Leucothrix pacifica]PWR00049.1 50S ribosomal protein L4 [Leucothrix pacifica]